MAEIIMTQDTFGTVTVVRQGTRSIFVDCPGKIVYHCSNSRPQGFEEGVPLRRILALEIPIRVLGRFVRSGTEE